MERKKKRGFSTKHRKTILVFCFLYTLTISVAMVASSLQSHTPQTSAPIVSDSENGLSSYRQASNAAPSQPLPSALDVDLPEPAVPNTPYGNIYPDLKVPLVTEYIAPQQKTVYLTFDDGPSAVTETVLATLKEYNIKATFFIVGDSVEGNEEILKHIVEQGHSIGLHSRTHNYKKVYASVEAFLEEYEYTNNLVKAITGEIVLFFSGDE